MYYLSRTNIFISTQQEHFPYANMQVGTVPFLLHAMADSPGEIFFKSMLLLLILNHQSSTLDTKLSELLFIFKNQMTLSPTALRSLLGLHRLKEVHTTVCFSILK